LGKQWKLDISPAEFREYQAQAEAAAHRLSQVSQVLYNDPAFTRRCWITKYVKIVPFREQRSLMQIKLLGLYCLHYSLASRRAVRSRA